MRVFSKTESNATLGFIILLCSSKAFSIDLCVQVAKTVVRLNVDVDFHRSPQRGNEEVLWNVLTNRITANDVKSIPTRVRYQNSKTSTSSFFLGTATVAQVERQIASQKFARTSQKFHSWKSVRSTPAPSSCHRDIDGDGFVQCRTSEVWKASLKL
jgi:hypothetical protein